jgi:hypothetical protein
MSIFGQLNFGDIKEPDVIINGSGGLLISSSGDGFRFPSTNINTPDTLLGDISPYNYGQGSVSDDIAYQVTPHKIQKIVPVLTLPSCTDHAHGDITLSHGVDDGDLAFTIRVAHDNTNTFFSHQNITRTVEPIVNLSTVNYIIRGLQTVHKKNKTKWQSFLQSTGWPIEQDGFHLEDLQCGEFQHRNISMFIQDYIRPLGVVIGSQHQGGQHQGGGVVDFPVDFVVTILVDGLCDNMLNFWRRTDIIAGDDLLLVLCGYQNHDSWYTKYIPLVKNKCLLLPEKNPTALEIKNQCYSRKCYQPAGYLQTQFSEFKATGYIQQCNYTPPNETTEYVLNHWYKDTQTMRFNNVPDLLFELVPTTSSEIEKGVFLGDDGNNRGLWHIARSQVQIKSTVNRNYEETFRNDSHNLKSGALIQATLSPMWESATRSHKSTVYLQQLQKVFHVITPYSYMVSKMDDVVHDIHMGCDITETTHSLHSKESATNYSTKRIAEVETSQTTENIITHSNKMQKCE